MKHTLLFLLLMVPFSAAGENVFVYPVNPGVQFYDPSITSNHDLPDPCFPYCGGGISGPYTNPNARARDEENLTSCSYDANGNLFYHRPGKVCPPEWK